MEGSHCYSPASGCDQSGLVQPVWEYGHGDGCSITGGYVYRGCRMPDLHGEYFFGDYCDGWVRSFTWSGGAADPADVTLRTQAPVWPSLQFTLASFGQDGEGEIYLLELSNPGRVFRIEPDLVP